MKYKKGLAFAGPFLKVKCQIEIVIGRKDDYDYNTVGAVDGISLRGY